ncbi:MAG: Gx transporter family protein [Christensenellales bacterium]
MRKSNTAYRLALIAILSAASLIVFVIENAFPPLFLPGAKLGLANLFTLISLIILSPFDAFVIATVRIVLGNIITGNPAAMIYALPAGFISLAVSAILVRTCIDKISITSISVVGAVLHNVVQNLVFCMVSGSTAMMSYTPYLALLGVLSGLTVGLAAYFILHYVPVSVYYKAISDASLSEKDINNKGETTFESN